MPLTPAPLIFFLNSTKFFEENEALHVKIRQKLTLSTYAILKNSRTGVHAAACAHILVLVTTVRFPAGTARGCVNYQH